MGILSIGVFLTATATSEAYSNILNILPSHSNHIAFKSKSLAIAIPIAGAI